MKLLENAVFESLTNTLLLQARDMRIDGRLVKILQACKILSS